MEFTRVNGIKNLISYYVTQPKYNYFRIAPATVTFITNQLLTSNDPEVREIAEGHDWYIFPSVNPDGYVYTHTTVRIPN